MDKLNLLHDYLSSSRQYHCKSITYTFQIKPEITHYGTSWPILVIEALQGLGEFLSQDQS